jgi:hypothetical protein
MAPLFPSVFRMCTEHPTTLQMAFGRVLKTRPQEHFCYSYLFVQKVRQCMTTLALPDARGPWLPLLLKSEHLWYIVSTMPKKQSHVKAHRLLQSTSVPYVRINTATPQHLVNKAFYRKTLHV